MIAVILPLILCLLAQRYIVRGLTLGAVKGKIGGEIFFIAIFFIGCNKTNNDELIFGLKPPH